MANKILKFGSHREVFSNTFGYPITYKGLTYQSLEAAYQAQKCPERANEFTSLTFNNARILGHQVELRPDWQDVKDSIMRELLTIKFSDRYMRLNLVETGTRPMVYDNTWHDNYWGYCTCKQCVLKEHLNKVGKFIEEIRSEMV